MGAINNLKEAFVRLLQLMLNEGLATRTDRRTLITIPWHTQPCYGVVPPSLGILDCLS